MKEVFWTGQSRAYHIIPEVLKLEPTLESARVLVNCWAQSQASSCFNIYLFICFWLCWSLLLGAGFSSCRELELLWSCGLRASQVSVLLHVASVVAARHVGSSRTRDQNCVLCMARQILDHWTTKEALAPNFWFIHLGWEKAWACVSWTCKFSEDRWCLGDHT